MAVTHLVSSKDILGRLSSASAQLRAVSQRQAHYPCNLHLSRAATPTNVIGQKARPQQALSSRFFNMDRDRSVLVAPLDGSTRKRGTKQNTTMQATGTDSKERTESIATPAEEAASRLGVGSEDFLNDPNKERGRQPVSEGVHPSVQLLIDVLKEEMPKFFSESGTNLSIYRPDVHFQDPQNNWHTLAGFKLNVYVLRAFFFGGRYLMHDIKATGKDEITARWTFVLPARFLPWTPTVILTGITKYGVDLEQAKLSAHIDYWDNLAGKEQKPVSIYALSSVVKQLQPLTAFNIPRDAPHEVIRKTKYYEIRRYAQDLTNPESKGEGWIAVERAKGTLIRQLQKDRIEIKSEKEQVRRLDSSWPGKKIEEVYVEVVYKPSVFDPVDYLGAESWRM